jgi:hypothetical protein
VMVLAEGVEAAVALHPGTEYTEAGRPYFIIKST